MDVDVEVLYEEHWRFGVLRQWSQYPDPYGWVGTVAFAASDGNRLGKFPAAQIRPCEADYREG